MIGKIMLAAGVLIAHGGLAHERRVDSLVLKDFKIERVLTIIGILLIFGGYLMEVSFYNYDTSLLTCDGRECAAAIPATLLNSQ